MKALTARQQIDVLENIDWEWIKLYNVGICHGIQRAICIRPIF